MGDICIYSTYDPIGEALEQTLSLFYQNVQRSTHPGGDTCDTVVTYCHDEESIDDALRLAESQTVRAVAHGAYGGEPITEILEQRGVPSYEVSELTRLVNDLR